MEDGEAGSARWRCCRAAFTAIRVNILEAALRRIAADLGRHGRRWALVGGFAVSARADPRFTRDIDVAVVVDDDSDSERLVRLLLADGYRLLASVEQEETGRLATVRLSSPLGGGDVVVDLLFASSGIEPETVQAAEVTEVVPGLSLPITTIGHLTCAPCERSRHRRIFCAARDAVRLIAARGFDRGRDLTAALKEIEQLRGAPADS